MIPKIIHQIWMQGENNIPKKFYNNIKIIKDMHPNWKYLLWDEIKILNMIKNDSDLLNTYYKFVHLHQKIDFAKYIMLYKYGGVYLDMDSYTQKPIDTLLEKYKNYDLILSKIDLDSIYESYFICGSNWCMNNGIILSLPKSIVLEKVIEEIIKNPICGIGGKFFCIQNTTGPSKFTKIIKKYMKEHPDINDVIILEAEYLEPCKLNKCNITENTYTVHSHEGSWLNDNFKSFGQFYVNNTVLFWIILILSIILFYYLYKYYWNDNILLQ
jgi:mannosyltransferase OCH1-like enzyme